MTKALKILDRIVDAVFAYKPPVKKKTVRAKPEKSSKAKKKTEH